MKIFFLKTKLNNAKQKFETFLKSIQKIKTPPPFIFRTFLYQLVAAISKEGLTTF